MNKVVLPPLPQGYEPHELPADYTGPLWIEGQLRARDIEVARVVLEAAANQAENTICSCCYPDGSDAVAEDISAAIRALEFTHDSAALGDKT